MIKYYVEESLRYFQFWGDAKPFIKRLTLDELDIMDDVLGECGDELSDVNINFLINSSLMTNLYS